MIIKNVKVVKDGQITEAEVEIEGSKIKKIGKSILSQDKILDGQGNLLLPGGVDNHVHIFKRYLKVPTSDTVRKSTIASAFGGTTTVIDFAFSDKSPNLDERISQFNESFTNYSFHIFANKVSENLKKDFERGFRSIKFMMIEYSGETGNLKGLKELNEFAKANNGYIMVHAEDEELINTLKDGRKGEPKLHLLTRPEETELSAVLRVNALVDKGLIAHVSCGKTLDLAKEGILAETTLHHLMLDKSVYDRKDAYLYVTSPPVRNPEEIWKRINKVHIIATDHNWFNKEVKGEHREFPDLVPGLPGVELRMEIIISEFIKRGLPLDLAIKLLSENPAKLNGLDTGKIQENYRADLVIYDLNKKWKISADNTHMADWTPYEGYEVIGKPKTVIINGEIVIENEELINDSFKGELLVNQNQDK
ncbi:amidohydrolase family protein [Acidianus manzaensis]|uniref:Amidohydrolase-related domain-containing protein n=1 Tax=Acidianus manzaensis TaxID=282676 RepID=A0A1W6JYL0_9CREN|nr:amidohydrolase family protein [Acidianus manzaensis]ARM75401.1 hypothetical protein B6F84_04730 [Acidianus manzaensis]